jgi:outer membrane lipoprotein LolB
MTGARRNFLAASAVLLVGALAGCATPARIDTTAPEAVFQRTGRFAVSVQYASGQQEAVQGGFAWLDTGRLLTLDLANPLGTTLARVQVYPGSATLTRTNGQQDSAPNPDALVEQVLGHTAVGGCTTGAARKLCARWLAC